MGVVVGEGREAGGVDRDTDPVDGARGGSGELVGGRGGRGG